MALEDQKKSIANNSGLLKDLLIGIENLGENLKSINQKIDSWRNQKSRRLNWSMLRLRGSSYLKYHPQIRSV